MEQVKVRRFGWTDPLHIAAFQFTRANGSNGSTWRIKRLDTDAEYGYIEKPSSWPADTCFKVIRIHNGPGEDEITIEPIDTRSSVPTITATSQGVTMNGSVYEGVVIQTRKVPAGEGVACAAVDESKIVLTTPAFIAKDDAVATGLVMAQALKAGIDVTSVVAPVEVKIRKY